MGQGVYRLGEEEEREERTSHFQSLSVPSGLTCSEEVTACHSEPCLNGGSCSIRPEGYSCTCLPSHTGPHCQTAVDHCVSGKYYPPSEPQLVKGAGHEGVGCNIALTFIFP